MWVNYIYASMTSAVNILCIVVTMETLLGQVMSYVADFNFSTDAK